MSAAGKEKEVTYFESAEAFEAWLEGVDLEHPGIWLKLRKKSSKIPAPTYDEALEIALCFGWIDGQKRSFDDDLYILSFTPRRSRSKWSKRNVEFVEQLIADGRMRPSGLSEVERAKADGRWEAAYDSPANAKPPEDFLAALAESTDEARAFYESLNATSRYTIYYRIQDAKKPETRQRRIEKFVGMLERGEKL